MRLSLKLLAAIFIIFSLVLCKNKGSGFQFEGVWEATFKPKEAKCQITLQLVFEQKETGFFQPFTSKEKMDCGEPFLPGEVNVTKGLWRYLEDTQTLELKPENEGLAAVPVTIVGDNRFETKIDDYSMVFVKK